MTINEAQDEVIEEFSDFTDWMDKYQLLIDLGNEQKPLDDKYKTEAVRAACGCRLTMRTARFISRLRATHSS
jgi:sulfur transfer protein SufE